MDIKIIFTIVASIIGTGAFLPYLIDIFSLRTKPHSFTWLIWSITQATAVFGVLIGGGSWGVLNLVLGTILVFIVFLFSLKYGVKKITNIDKVVLVLVLCAILIWWQLDDLLLAVIMVSAIDVLGYIPSFIKSYKKPWSETLIAWFAFAISNIFAILALSEYNLLTMTYLVSITFANLTLFFICFLRRRFVAKPKSF